MKEPANIKCIQGLTHYSVLTEFRDATHTGSEQGLFQRPQLQLGIGILPAVYRRLLVLCVGTEMGWERQNTYRDKYRETMAFMINMMVCEPCKQTSKTSATIHSHCSYRNPKTNSVGYLQSKFIILVTRNPQR